MPEVVAEHSTHKTETLEEQVGEMPSPRFLRKLGLVELWAGIATLSACFWLLAGVPLFAFCEADPLLFYFLTTKHPEAQTATLFEKNQWRSWKFNSQGYTILVGGPSCTSLSTAGKQLAGEDPTSRYLFDHLRTAAYVSALLVLLENVCWLVDGDEEHGLFTQLKLLASALGYTLTAVWRVKDCLVGGFTQRERVFLLFEKSTLVSILPVIQTEKSERVAQRAMAEVLLSAAQTPPEAWLQPSTLRLISVSEVAQGQATRVAECTLSWRGRTTERGALVQLKPRSSGSGKNRWRVMGWRGKKVELRRADRKSPTFRLVKPSDILHGLTETIFVYSIDGIGIGLRRWGEPPLNNAFAVLKRKGGELLPCVIVPIESWRLHGLSDADYQLLVERGAAPEDIASAAGNCITMAMSGHIVRKLLRRLCDYEIHEAQLVLALRVQIPKLSWISPARSVVLLPVHLGSTAACLIGADGRGVLHTPLYESGRAHKAASKMAADYAYQLFDKQLEVILCGQFDNVIAFCVPVAEQDALSPLQWSTSQQTEGEATRLLVSLAVMVAMSCVPPPRPIELQALVPAESEWQDAQRELVRHAHLTGARGAVLVETKLSAGGVSEEHLQNMLRLDSAASRELQHHIELQSTDIREELRASYLAWSDCVRPLPLADMPTDLHLDLGTFEHPRLLDVPIPDPCPPHRTKWLPREPAQVAPEGFRPTGITDLLEAWAILMIWNWVYTQLEYLAEVSELGVRAIRKSNKALALGQDAFKPQARGIVWDLRKLEEGIITPVDFEAPIESHLNLELLREELADWPDQELVSFLLEGVRYKADVGMQIVLLPHLVSLRDGYGSLQAEVDKYAQAGWYGLFSHPAFLPFRLIPKGSVPRKLEPERPRPTTEAGAPRNLLLDTLGNPVVSINEASSGLTPQAVLEAGEKPRVTREAKWPKERKPSVGHVLQAIAILLAAGLIIGEALFCAADDFRNFFNQLRCSPEEFHKCGMLLTKNGQPVFATEYIMTFGLRPASNIAQRFADAILAIWKKRFAEREAPFVAQLLDKFPGLAACKAAVASSLAAAFIYTDDPIFLALSAPTMARALLVWTETCADLGLLMAIPAKRQCGTWVEWLGAGICATMGFAWVPTAKRLTALNKLYAVLLGTITIDAYHSLLGLLEHLVYLQGMRRSLMYGMWEPFKRGVSLEPNRILNPTPMILKQARAWVKKLNANSAVSALCMVQRLPAALRATVFTLTSDACVESRYAGLGGWFHGHYWSVMLAGSDPFDRACRRLPIAALEFIAAIASIFSFASLLPQLDPDNTILHARVDALATPYILTEDAASSSLMVKLHSFVLEQQLFSQIAPILATSHVFGMTNELADAASRADTRRLMRLASQLRISPTLMSPHAICFELLHCAVECR